jgi:hypothetical protein
LLLYLEDDGRDKVLTHEGQRAVEVTFRQWGGAVPLMVYFLVRKKNPTP